MRLFEPLVLLLATGLSITFILLHVPTRTEQITIAFLLLILFVNVSKLITVSALRAKSTLPKLFTLFLSSFMVQLLVVSSGGFYSPFLFLFHLFTLGSGLLMTNSTSISFLVLSVGLLFLDIKIDPLIYQNFQTDPWPTVIYFISFLVIVPVSFLVTRSYRVKDSLSKILNEYVQIGKMREESILSGVNEIVFVTDISLSILYLNSTAEKEAGVTSAQALKQGLLKVLNLRDGKGKQATVQALAIDKALIDKATRVVEGFYLQARKKTKVSIQVRPITDLNGKVTQIVFVLTDATMNDKDILSRHLNLEQANNKYKAVFDDLQKTLVLTGSKELISKVELVHKFEEDLLIATEIEDHAIKEQNSYQDVALLCKQVVVTKQNFSKGLQIPLEFSLSNNEASEAAMLSLAETANPPIALPMSSYMVPADFRWLSVLVQKIIDICLFLSVGEVKPQVTVELSREGNSAIIINITTTTTQIDESDKIELFKENFGELGTTTYLRFGSGLEGFIIKSIEEQLGIPVDIKFGTNPGRITFTITLSKKPH